MRNIVLWLIFSAICALVFFKCCQKPIAEEILESIGEKARDSINELNNELVVERYISDSLKKEMVITEAKLLGKNNNTTIIKIKYEKIRTVHLQLNAVSAVELLAKNLSTDTVN